MKTYKRLICGLPIMLVLLSGWMYPRAVSQKNTQSACLLISGSVPIPGQYVAGSAQGSTNTMGQQVLLDAISGHYAYVHSVPSVPDLKSIVSFSPDGRYKAYRVSEDKLIIETISTGTDVAIFHPKMLIGLPEWSPDGNHLYYLASTLSHRGTVQSFIGLALSDGSNASRLIPIPSDYGIDNRNIRSFRLDSLWSPDGRYFKFVDHNILLVVDTHTWQTQLVAIPDDGPRESFWSPNGHLLSSLWSDTASSVSENKLTIFDPSTQQDFAIFPPTGLGISNYEWSPNGAYLAVKVGSNSPDFTDRTPDRLMLYSPDGVQIADIGNSSKEDYNILWTWDSQAIVFVQSQTNSLSVYSIKENKTTAVIPNLWEPYLRILQDGRTIIALQRQGDAAAIVKFDLATSQVTTLVRAKDKLQIDFYDTDSPFLFFQTIHGADKPINLNVVDVDLNVINVNTGETHQLLGSVAELQRANAADPASTLYWWRTKKGEVGVNNYSISGQLKQQFKPYFPQELRQELYSSTWTVWESPDHGRAVVVQDGSNPKELRIAFSDGRQPKIIIRESQIGISYPKWSPDSSMFAFIKETSTGQDIKRGVQIYSKDGQLIGEYQGLLLYEMSYEGLKWTDCTFAKDTF